MTHLNPVRIPLFAAAILLGACQAETTTGTSAPAAPATTGAAGDVTADAALDGQWISRGDRGCAYLQMKNGKPARYQYQMRCEGMKQDYAVVQAGQNLYNIGSIGEMKLLDNDGATMNARFKMFRRRSVDQYAMTFVKDS